MATAGGYTYDDHNAGATQSVQNEKLQLLKSIAQHGSRGQEVYEMEKAAEAARRAGAITASTDAGSTMTNTDTVTAELARKRAALNAGLDTAAASKGTQSADDFARLSAASGAYMDQTGASAARNTEILREELIAAGEERDAAAAAAARSAASRSYSPSGSSSSDDSGFSYNYEEPSTTPLTESSDPATVANAVRDQLSAMQSQGVGSEAMGDWLVDYLDASPLGAAQIAQITASMDNSFGLTDSGKAGKSELKDYFYPEAPTTKQAETASSADNKYKAQAKTATKPSTTKRTTSTSTRKFIVPKPVAKKEPIKISTSEYNKMKAAGVLKYTRNLGRGYTSTRTYTLSEWNKLPVADQEKIMEAYELHKKNTASGFRSRNMR